MKTQEPTQETEITVIEPIDLDKPQKDTDFAHTSANLLMDIVAKNNWAKKLGGEKAHLQYEAWQTVGKYYGYTVKTHNAEYVELAGVAGFKAYATVVNEKTGIEVGAAEAYCMKDEYNWKSKPTFQLASMAQTRAGSKALRQILGFVVALAGYNATPAEEIENTALDASKQIKIETKPVAVQYPISLAQMKRIEALLHEKKISDEKYDEVLAKFHVSQTSKLMAGDANKIIAKFESVPTPKSDFTFKKQVASN